MSVRRDGDGTEPAHGRPGVPVHIVIVGGGYVGMYTALRLQRRLRRDEARITVIEPRPNMTYQPFLPEAAAGSLEPRHVVVSLRRTLKPCDVITARVTAIDHGRRAVTAAPSAGPPYELGYDIIVVALGSVARTLPIPGLADAAIGFKHIEEAIALRNRVLERLDTASSVSDDDTRRRSLTFVVVGGGYAGVEALAELEDMARYATRYYDNIRPDDMRWVLVEASDRILPEVGSDLGRYTVDQLRRRRIDVLLRHRTYQMSRMPTLNKKMRVVMDWTLALFFRREVVSLGQLHSPREEFERVSHELVDADRGT